MSNSNIKHVVFDLDGTLINSFHTIYKTTVKTLQELNVSEPLPEDAFYDQIGQHFVDIFREMKIPVQDFEKFIEIYKKYYFDYINDSHFYPEVEETIKSLHQNKIKISLLTTKIQEQADIIIDHFGLRDYFDYVMGRRYGIANKPAAEPLQIICKDLNIDVKETMMVGDTELDLMCGKNAGSYTCGVLYGYRSKETLEKYKPDYLISGIGELSSILDKMNRS